MPKVKIHKVPTNNLEGWTHCWVPIVNGRLLEFTRADGTTEPFRSVRGAKRTAARELGLDTSEITFEIERGN